MAAEEKKRISLKVLVEKKQNRIVFAEADKEFVDVLFSFLTLPIGTIVRLLSKLSEASVIGSMNNLYNSVANLEAGHFKNDTCKSMLLRTRNSCADECRRLTLNIDDTEPTKAYYLCSNWSKDYKLSTFHNTPCACGRQTRMPVQLSLDNIPKVDKDAVFVKGLPTFIITDDLQVMPMSTERTFDLLTNFGITDAESLEKRTIDVSLRQVLLLLDLSLHSNHPLTDLILQKRRVRTCEFDYKSMEKLKSLTTKEVGNFKNMNLKIVVRKSMFKVLYAEVGEDFISFLFSMLTFPLGSVKKLLDQTLALGCIANLYNSVRRLDCIKDKQKLISPKLALQYGINNLLGIQEVTHPNYCFNYKTCTLTAPKSCPVPYKPYLAPCESGVLYSSTMSFLDPKSPSPEETTGHGYVKGPNTFMVTDDLVVMPVSSFSTLSILQQFKVAFNDI